MEKIKENVSKHGFLIVLALVLVIIIIIIYNVYITNMVCNDLLEGLWTTSETFCAKAGIDGMLIYIGPNENSWDPRSQERKAYLVMYSNDNIIANKKFTMTIQGSILDKLNPFAKQKIYKQVYLHDPQPENVADQIEEEIEDVSQISLKKIMPLTQNVEINISEGQMIWKNDDTVYLEAYKDNLGSHYGKME
jgi:hypothetical protein